MFNHYIWSHFPTPLTEITTEFIITVLISPIYLPVKETCILRFLKAHLPVFLLLLGSPLFGILKSILLAGVFLSKIYRILGADPTTQSFPTFFLYSFHQLYHPLAIITIERGKTSWVDGQKSKILVVVITSVRTLAIGVVRYIP